MAIKYADHIDLQSLELRNATAHNLASAPSSPGEGRYYYDTADHTWKYWNGTTWVTLAEGTGGPPTGSAGGDLSGTYPNPQIAAGVIVNADISGSAAIALSKLATDPLARANHTGTQTASTISDFDTQVRTSRLDQMAAPTADVSMNSHKITNVTDPSSAQDAATKAYVDNLAQGLDFKNSVRVATTANGALASAFENGDTIDGVALATGDRILIKDQTTGSENGIYTVNASGAPTRATDSNSSGELSKGSIVYVESGTANGGQLWVVTATASTPWVPGTDSSTWSLYFAATSTQAGGGLTATSNVFAVGAGTGITVNADNVAVDTSVIKSISASEYNADIGDGSSVAITVTHSLGTKDVQVIVYNNSSPFEEIHPTVEHTSTSALTLRFATAPTSNQYRAVVKK